MMSNSYEPILSDSNHPLEISKCQQVEASWASLSRFARRMKWSLVILLISIASIALSQVRPNIDDNFSADVIITESRETHKVKMTVRNGKMRG